MPDISFNTNAGQTIAREMLIVYLNTGTAASPVWSAIGKRVEDSSTEIDWDTETIRDILGATYGTMKKPTVKQTFDPCDLDSDDAAQVRIWNLAVKDQDYNALAAQDMLLVHFYAGSAATPFAERYASCMIEATGLGGKGGGNLGMPLTITFGGTRTTGTASKDASTGEVTFTPVTLPSVTTSSVAALLMRRSTFSSASTAAVRVLTRYAPTGVVLPSAVRAR